MTLPDTTPATITAGATTKWRRTLSDYPATAGWALTVKLRGPSPGLDVNASADGSAFLVTLSAAQTAKLAGGLWQWQEWVEKAGEKYLTDEGTLTVKGALPEAHLAVDARTRVKRTLDAIDAMIEGKASLDQQEYQIGDRMLKRYSLTDLITLRRAYAKLYAQELEKEHRQNGGYMQNILTRFNRPS